MRDLKVPTHPAILSWRRSSQQRSERGYSLSLLAGFPGLDACPFDSVSHSPARAHEQEAVSVCEGLRDFLRVAV